MTKAPANPARFWRIACFYIVPVVGIAVLAATLWQSDAAFSQTGPTGAEVPVVSPGIHSLTLQRTGEPAVRYAVSIPASYTPSTRVPLVLALLSGPEGVCSKSWSRRR
jgi:hypothetical protein